MTIRNVSLDDCDQMNILARELGYPSNSEKMREILQLVMTNQNQQIFIAEIDHNLAGYLHLVGSNITASGGSFEIAALLVDKKFRSKGIGNAFLQKAEETARIKNATYLRIRTTLISPEAYKFFEDRGFVNLSNENAYVKELL
jgi:N-acetylglutamate synthase-like GNAT family acetyltransferase